MPSETIVIASDHRAVELKTILAKELEVLGFDVLDLGTAGPESVDYPDYAEALAAAIHDGRARRGVLMCGTGIGMSIAANRHRDVRAALVHDQMSARMARQHNNANVLVLGGNETGAETAKDCLAAFLETEFEGGRHEPRVAKMS
ncbi:MAG: ribose 5-phosphate isomerase B [Alphaproteobacteria bacterium]|nr:ribose 5-phosphate isomerase B [Alphaproteobacteria bacterium]MCZ6885418.1 ribose 5-phosphate isomerase B [Alphaproteobacteria bacterium]